VSVRTLHRAFARDAVSVMGYIREQRLRHARMELTTTSLSASEIATRWHFADVSHFSRLFKKQFGQLPSDLRRRSGPRAQ
jgi:AraC-like DNA-binding protein